MFTRKELKIRAKSHMKTNYFRMLIVCFLMVFLLGSYGSTNILDVALEGMTLGTMEAGKLSGQTDTQIVNEFVRLYGGSGVISLLNQRGVTVASKGFLGVLFSNVLQANSSLYGALNSINQLLFHDSVGATIIICIGIILKILFVIFISNLAEIGRDRFFMENHSYSKTGMRSVLLPFRVKAIWNQAMIILFRWVFQFLWCFTIVGGFIKHYEYLMIPYIVAENPKVKRKDAFSTSKEMMRGHKWEAFLLDLSFIIWFLPGIIAVIGAIVSLYFPSVRIFTIICAVACALLGIFYIVPYMDATAAELYLQLRTIYLDTHVEKNTVFCDSALLPCDSLEERAVAKNYPLDQYPYPLFFEKMVQFHYERDYSFFSYVWMFFVLSIGGYLWEVMLYFFTFGRFINRGSLHGPWLPIYGTGAVLVLLLLRKLLKKPPLFVGLAAVICGGLEYVVSYVAEKVFHIHYWDYTGYVLNINGRICLEGVVTFALAATIVGYIVAPLLDTWFLKINKSLRQGICIGLICFIVVDGIYSFIHPNEAGKYIEKTTAVEETSVSEQESIGAEGAVAK